MKTPNLLQRVPPSELENAAAYARLTLVTRRHFLQKCTTGLGAMAMAVLGEKAWGSDGLKRDLAKPMEPWASHFAPRAKRVIYIHLAGAPSQLELFDYKPLLHKLDGQDCPQEFLAGKRFAFIQGVPKMLGPQYTFKQHGTCGAWVSDRLPHFAKLVDDVCFIKSMYTDQFNHAPAQLLMQTGMSRLGFPSLGSWVAYGLGSENDNLPGFVVLVSGGNNPDAGKSVWGSGFLPSVYQGVQCRSKGDPILYVGNPEGVDRDLRRRTLDAIRAANEEAHAEFGDAETMTRIAQYEMAFKMQLAVPDAMDIAREPAGVHAAYGTKPGEESFANNCLLARRLVERGVRFVQLYDWGWDSHGAAKSEALNGGFVEKCRTMDQPVAALLRDLKQRGLLDETLVVWGGEFGRTPMRENRGGKEMAFIGRDHNPGAFTVWMAGGGVKPGFTLGETDESGYTATKDRVFVHDLQATIMHLLGFDHTKLTYHFQGRDFRITDTGGQVVRKILA